MDCGVQVEVSKVLVVVTGGGVVVVVVRQLQALEMRCGKRGLGLRSGTFGGMRDGWALTEGPQVAMPLGAVLVLEEKRVS